MKATTRLRGAAEQQWHGSDGGTAGNPALSQCPTKRPTVNDIEPPPRPPYAVIT